MTVSGCCYSRMDSAVSCRFRMMMKTFLVMFALHRSATAVTVTETTTRITTDSITATTATTTTAITNITAGNTTATTAATTATGATVPPTRITTTTAPVYSVQCTYSWTLAADTNVEDGIIAKSVSSVSECQQWCIKYSSCEGVDWIPARPVSQQCWISGRYWSGRRNNGTASGVTHYDLTRNCTTATASSKAVISTTTAALVSTTTNTTATVILGVLLALAVVVIVALVIYVVYLRRRLHGKQVTDQPRVFSDMRNRDSTSTTYDELNSENSQQPPPVLYDRMATQNQLRT